MCHFHEELTEETALDFEDLGSEEREELEHEDLREEPAPEKPTVLADGGDDA